MALPRTQLEEQAPAEGSSSLDSIGKILKTTKPRDSRLSPWIEMAETPTVLSKTVAKAPCGQLPAHSATQDSLAKCVAMVPTRMIIMTICATHVRICRQIRKEHIISNPMAYPTRITRTAHTNVSKTKT